MTLLAYSLWCSFCWLLRGGKFGAIVRRFAGWEPGTTVTRIACAFLMAAPLTYFVGPTAAALLWLFLYLSMVLGYFGGSMGAYSLREVGLLSLWGVTVATIASLPFLWNHLTYWPLLASLVGPSYWLNRQLGRRWGLDWTERGELSMGIFMGVVLGCQIWG